MRALRYSIEFVVAWLAIKLIQFLPISAAQALGRGLGRVAFNLGVARATALKNLQQRLGEQDPRRLRQLALDTYASFGQTVLEVMLMSKLSSEQIAATFTFENLSVLDRLKAEGRGAICLSGHYGNWEWMAVALAARGYPITLLIGTLSNPWTDALFIELRARHGLQILRTQAIRSALRALKQGRMLAFVGDQDGDKWGIFAPFFGVEASTHRFGELLARKAGAAILFGVAERLSPRESMMRVESIPEAPAGLSEAQATAYRLKAYNALLEAAIRRHPEQWLWMHRRWQSVALHRLQGEQRRRAEAGEIRFDMEAQVWKRADDGETVTVEGWR